MHQQLSDHARAQGGVFSAQQAAQHRVSARDLTRLVARGDVVRVRRGAFVLAEPWTSADAVGQLALRTRAVMAGREGAVAAGASALAIHGLPLWGVPLDQVLLHGPVARVRSHRGITVIPHLELPEAELVETGVRTTSIPYAVVQLCASVGHRAALVTLDAALHAKRVRLSEVREAASAEALALTPKQAWHVDRMGDLADQKCESVGETRTRLLLLDLGYAPRSQVALSDVRGFVARVDFLVADRVVVEFDGLMKYEGLNGRAALVAEKRREDRLRAMGFVVVRLVWADLESPERVAELMRRAVSQIRRDAPEPSAP